MKPCVLVNLSTRCWSGVITDRRMSDSLAADEGVPADRLRVEKRLVAKEAIRKVKLEVERTREYVESVSLPWLDRGMRVLPASRIMEIRETFSRRTESYKEAVREFCEAYPALVEDQRGVLNGSFRESDFPPTSEIERHFHLSLGVYPFPKGEDFRLDPELENRLREEFESEKADCLKDATKALALRVVERLTKISSALHQPDKVFRDSLVENLRELVKALPEYNLTGDPRLTAFEAELASIAAHEPDALREDKARRAEVAAKAQAAADRLRGVF